MDGHRFDHWTTIFAAAVSRRAVFTSLAGAVLLGRLGTGAATAQEATVHWDHCRHVGARCRRHRQCCSNRCRGRRRRKRCQAHHQGTCRSGQDFCLQHNEATCNGRTNCACLVTTGGARFCGGLLTCGGCRRDAECVAAGFGPGAACVEAAVGFCDCPDTAGSGTGCARACPPPA